MKAIPVLLIMTILISCQPSQSEDSFNFSRSPDSVKPKLPHDDKEKPNDDPVDKEPDDKDPKDPPVSSDVDVERDVYFPTAEMVDSYYPSKQALTKNRPNDGYHEIEGCIDELQNVDTFGRRAAHFVNLMTKPNKPRVDTVASSYNLPNKIADHQEIELDQIKLCPVSESSLRQTLNGSKRVPAASTIQKLQKFSNLHNKLIADIKLDIPASKIRLERLWTKMLYCLSYTESLSGSPDSSYSRNIASKHAPSDYDKAEGVTFYEDPLQDEVSRLNIGIYQFTPNTDGNIKACIRSWNDLHPKCQIKEKLSKGESIKLLGSNFQTFNSFCGVNKIMQSFAVQVNTRSSGSTHPANIQSGKLVSANNRCVSPFFYSGKAYNHFGPLMNSTGKNLEHVIGCTMRDIEKLME